jgi:hypothetical protein
VASYRPATDVPVVQCFGGPNLLAISVYNAFYQHYPLKLNPNVIWVTIVQGFASYVNQNAEAIRTKLVTHPGQMTIKIVRPDFRYESPDNDWASVFPQFADAIEQSTQPGVRQAVECAFSNTTPVDRACSHISLMNV